MIGGLYARQIPALLFYAAIAHPPGKTGIKYFSGTAVYAKFFDLPAFLIKLPALYLQALKH